MKAHSILFPEAMGVLKALNTRFDMALITNTQGQPTSATHRINEFPELERYFRVMAWPVKRHSAQAPSDAL